MNIIFWVTEQCNLKCDYCYVKKTPQIMSIATAESAFQFFKKKFQKRQFKEREIHIGFHGGEPLLNFTVIQYLTERFKAEYGNKIRYFSLTTNGTIFDEKMFQYLMSNIQLSVSIDGKRETNDLMRHRINGESIFDLTVNVLEYLKENKTPVRVRMTVNQKTIKDFADNFIYLDQKEYGVVTYAINQNDKWNEVDMEEYERQLGLIMEYYKEKKRLEGKYFLFNLREATFRERTLCDGGMTNFHISPTGEIYPCIMSLNNPEFCLGNTYDGINDIAMRYLQDINKSDVRGCGECEFRGHCSSQVCKIINKMATGDYYCPSSVSCQERKVIYNCCKKYEHILEKFHA